MRRTTRLHRICRHPMLGRIDRAAKEMNPLLVLVAVVLLLLNVNCYWALMVARIHPPRHGPGQSIALLPDASEHRGVQ